MSGFLLAFAIKIPIFPFHSWQANTYDAAPMAGTMLLSAIMLKMALFGLIKWMIPLNPGGLSFWQLPVIILGVVGILYGALIATRENNIKKVFAFASLSHLGLIVAGIMIFTQESLTASVVQMVNHSLIAIGLFLAANRLEVGFGSKELSTMGGIAKLAPTFGVWFGIITLIALSVPLTAGFLGEFLLIKSVFQFNLWLGVLSSLTLVLGAVYMLRSYQMSMMGAPAIGTFEDLPLNEILVYFIITALTLFIGLFPEFLIQIIKPSIEQIILHTQNPALTIR
jgi:NADH-quinone oxidoreductase subunit M